MPSSGGSAPEPPGGPGAGPPPKPRIAAGAAQDAGAGVLSASFGLLFFLGFLLLAAQLLVGAYAKSVVSAAAHDAGRVLATAAGADGLLDAAEASAGSARAAQRVRDLLGPEATFAVVRLDTAASIVEVEATAPGPRLLLGGGGLGSDRIARRVTVRLEHLQ